MRISEHEFERGGAGIFTIDGRSFEAVDEDYGCLDVEETESGVECMLRVFCGELVANLTYIFPYTVYENSDFSDLFSSPPSTISLHRAAG